MGRFLISLMKAVLSSSKAGPTCTSPRVVDQGDGDLVDALQQVAEGDFGKGQRGIVDDLVEGDVLSERRV